MRMQYSTCSPEHSFKTELGWEYYHPSKDMPELYIVRFYSPAVDHMGLYLIEDDPSVGTFYHVTGSVPMGFVLEIRQDYRASESSSYIPGSMELQGKVEDVIALLFIINNTPPPPAQNIRIRPHMNCQTWVFEVIQVLKEHNILV